MAGLHEASFVNIDTKVKLKFHKSDRDYLLDYSY